MIRCWWRKDYEVKKRSGDTVGAPHWGGIPSLELSPGGKTWGGEGHQLNPSSSSLSASAPHSSSLLWAGAKGKKMGWDGGGAPGEPSKKKEANRPGNPLLLHLMRQSVKSWLNFFGPNHHWAEFFTASLKLNNGRCNPYLSAGCIAHLSGDCNAYLSDPILHQHQSDKTANRNWHQIFSKFREILYIWRNPVLPQFNMAFQSTWC